ncbi:MAG: hypothetical protein HYU30_05485 [Chloroflexi bacterium]|nr:hypothetical protein [Chloroflexota bacterium]
MLLHTFPNRLLPLALMLLTSLATGACQDVSDWLVGRGATPLATAAPTPQVQQPVAPHVSAAIKEGRLYLKEALNGASLLYEPWVDYPTVQQVKDTFMATQQVQSQELGVAELPPIDLFVTWESPFNLFAGQNQFQHPSWLAGFAVYGLAEGRALDARVYINAQAKGLVHNTAHELTHIAAPALPQWLGEGVAEYVAVRVDLLIGTDETDARTLQARLKVRQAAEQGRLLMPQELDAFPWDSPPDYTTLDLAYAEGWQMVEYVAAAYGSQVLSQLVAGYAKAPDESLATFETVLSRPAQEVWQAFMQHVLANVSPAEQVGDALCRLTSQEAAEADLTRDWNQFLERSNRQNPVQDTQEFLRFGQRWAQLSVDVADTVAPGDAGPIKETLFASVQTMQRAMELLAQGSAAAANSSLSAANQGRLLAHAQLQRAIRERSAWLTCAAPLPP